VQPNTVLSVEYGRMSTLVGAGLVTTRAVRSMRDHWTATMSRATPRPEEVTVSSESDALERLPKQLRVLPIER
jgi:hypothetical protein